MTTHRQFIEDHADEGGDHLVVRGQAFASDDIGYRQETEKPSFKPYDQANYQEYLTGTD